MSTTKTNNLVCFTNCSLALEDGSLVQRDLWVDEEKGVILDAQKTFFEEGRRPDTTIDLGGDILSPGFIDVQINGAYGFDFSLFHNEDTRTYHEGLKMVARKIVETGVTSLVPTIITQRKSLYTKILPLLKPASHPNSAVLLGWHTEGPFLQPAKRGAHMTPFLLTAPAGVKTFEEVYGAEELRNGYEGVRIITAAPEIEGVIPAIEELTKRGVNFSIGHSIASSQIASSAVVSGARLITHLFNAMPQLHHRDPSIIGLLGAPSSLASPNASPLPPASAQFTYPGLKRTGSTVSIGSGKSGKDTKHVSEALGETLTPPDSPVLQATVPAARVGGKKERENEHAERRAGVFERPYYGLIVDGCHLHPHSVRLAYTAHPEGCILITDAVSMLDPHLKDGIHEWRDGRRLVKEGVRLYIEGTDTLAGSVVTMDTCVRNFSQFTGCTLGEAIKCATYNPAASVNIEDRKGTLRAGADADLVLLDASGKVKGTWVSGKKVWSEEAQT